MFSFFFYHVFIACSVEDLKPLKNECVLLDPDLFRGLLFFSPFRISYFFKERRFNNNNRHMLLRVGMGYFTILYSFSCSVFCSFIIFFFFF